MAQITSVTSEALQAEIRRLLPSQQGFGEDLQASNVITPIIDLTSAAEGSSVGQNLQTALAFGSQTEFARRSSGSTTIINTAGFFQITGFVSIVRGSADNTAKIQLNDGSTTKDIYVAEINGGSQTTTISENVNLVVFLRSTDSCLVNTNSAGAFIAGSTRQIADVNGVLVNPVGFTPQ